MKQVRPIVSDREIEPIVNAQRLAIMAVELHKLKQRKALAVFETETIPSLLAILLWGWIHNACSRKPELLQEHLRRAGIPTSSDEETRNLHKFLKRLDDALEKRGIFTSL